MTWFKFVFELLDALEQGDAADFDGFVAADGADGFASFGFDSDLVNVDVEDTGDAVADGVLVVGEFGAFGVDHAIEVYDVVTGFVDSGGGGVKHFGGFAGTVGGVGVGEQAADIWQRGGTEQGIGNGVQQHIGIAVADELVIVRHVDAAEA